MVSLRCRIAPSIIESARIAYAPAGDVNFDQWLSESASGGIRYYSLARHALTEALRVAEIGPGDAVLLPEFLCRDVLASLSELNAIPRWYPVGEDLTPVGMPDAWPDARAVLAVDYFGFPQPLEPFRAYAARTGVLIIEDNAHGFLSRDENGQYLGTRGDLGIFSLRKTLPLADGAALMAGSPELAGRLRNQVPPAGLGYAPNAARKARLRRTPGVGVAVASVTTSLVRTLRRLRTDHAIPPPEREAETSIPHPPAPHAGLAKGLAALDVGSEIDRRRDLYRAAEQAARVIGIVPAFPGLPPLVAPYGFPFRTNASEALREMNRWAVRRGLDLIRWPDLPDALTTSAPAHYRNLYLVNFLW